MILYDRSPEHDLMLARWYAELIQSGDFEDCLFRNAGCLSGFFEVFKQPNSLLFELDEESLICRAAWFEPIFNGAFFSFWLRADQRASKDSLAFFCNAAETGLMNYAVLIGVTKQPELLDTHRKAGYNIIGAVPNLWDQKDAYICVLTEEGWKESKYGRRRKVGADLGLQGS